MAKKDDFAFAQWKNFFTDTAFQFYCSGKKDYEAGKYLSAIVWSAVFVEALLKDILSEFGVNHEGAMLNSLIERTQANLDKVQGIDKKDKKLLCNILDRCDFIRKTRNGLFHDDGLPKSHIEQEAQSIYDLHLDVILGCYVETSVAKAIEKKNSISTGMEAPASDQPTFRIFVSTITPYTFEQAVFIEAFCKRLEEVGAVPVRCKPEDFGTRRPMEVVREMIEKCNAVVVLGLEKYHVYHYVEKKGSSAPKESINKSFSSEWLQIESGIAVGLGKKLFALHQKNLHQQGIFDHDWNSIRPVEMGDSLNAESIEVDSVLRDIRTYMDEYMAE